MDAPVTDPIRLEIVKNALATAAEEMGLTVVRSAYSSVVKEGGDATSAIFDGAGQLVAQSVGAPLMHLASLRPSLRAIIEDFPVDAMVDGDVFASNDPYRGGIHSNDIMVFRPVFIEGAPAFFTCALLHVADVGGMAAGGLPATATEMFHEGLVLPPVALYRGGEPNKGILDVIASNSRTPDKVMGDIRAMVAGTSVGARRVVELIDRYGLDELLDLVTALLDYTERRTRHDLAQIPAGTYTGRFVVDDDGIEPERDHPVEVAVTIADGTLHADFTGTAPQARGPINASMSQSLSGVLYAARCLVSPDIPVNEGSFRPLDVELPPGTLVNPARPAACNARMATVMAIVEAMLEAFSGIDVTKSVAGSCNAHVYIMNGVDSESGKPWAFLDPQFGGNGARYDRDGIDAAGPLILGGSGALHAVEAYEIEHPVRFHEFSLWADSGGPGRWRGGLGTRRRVEILTDGEFHGRATDRCRIPPPGRDGGSPGAPGGWIVNEHQPDERRLPPKITNHALDAGEIVTELTSAGGGFGDPFARDPELVAADIRDGRVSLEAADADYGVVVSADGKVDVAATSRRRGR